MTKTLEEIARDFEKENPKVKVKVVNVPNAGEVLKTRVLAGDVPDVVNIYPQSIELQEWAKAGVFEDLSNKDYLKRVKNGYAEKYAVNGKVYNVPFTANAYGIYYNKDKFEELGLKVPETWDEFEQLVKDIVAKYPKPAPPYTTVASIVKNLERKQYIRAARVGNTYQYTPLIRESEYKRTFMSGFVGNYFENSYKEMVSFFAKDQKISANDLKDIIDMIEKGKE